MTVFERGPFVSFFETGIAAAVRKYLAMRRLRGGNNVKIPRGWNLQICENRKKKRRFGALCYTGAIFLSFADPSPIAEWGKAMAESPHRV